MSRALISSTNDQDGNYLAEHLLRDGYEVIGLTRRASTFNTDPSDHLYRDPHEEGTRLSSTTPTAAMAPALVTCWVRLRQRTTSVHVSLRSLAYHSEMYRPEGVRSEFCAVGALEGVE